MRSGQLAAAAPRRALVGPLLTILVALALRGLEVAGLPVPNLGVILLAAVIFSVLRGGWKSGVASGALALAALAWLRAQRGPIEADAVRFWIDLAVTAPVVIVLGRLVAVRARAATRERTLRRAADAARARSVAILESIRDGFFAVDRDWRYVYVNAQAERIVGRLRGELLGKAIWDVFPPLVGSRWDREFHRARDSGEAVHFEAYYPPFETWFETFAFPSEAGMSIYVRDVNDRVHAEKALRSRVLQQAAIAHIGKLALAERDLQALLDETVARLAAVFGVEMAKVLELQPDGSLLLRAGVGWKPGLVGSATVGPGTDSQAGYTLLSGAPVVVEDLRSERRFSGPPLLAEHGVVSGMSVAIQGPDGPWGILAMHSRQRRSFTPDDVSFLTGMAQVVGLTLERRRAITALRDSEARFRQFAENTRDLLFMTDVNNSNAGYINPVYEQLWGRTVESWYQDPSSWLEAVHPEDLPKVLAAKARVAQQRGFDEEFRVVRSDGSVRLVHARVFGLTDQPGQTSRVGGLVEDITERRRLADERTARASAEARVSTRDEVLAMVSHDLRNPLNAIALTAGALERHLPAPAAGRDLAVIRQSVAQMNRLIRDLLDASRIEASGLSLERTEIAPERLMNTAADAFALEATSKSIELAVACEAAPTRFVGDRERLLQALENLLANALKFTPAGGNVWLAGRSEGDRIRLSVGDTGPGIPPEHVAHLFERFWQAKGDRRGVGLGLPIVKGIAEAHGGRVWMEPRPGGGSLFYLELPVAAPP